MPILSYENMMLQKYDAKKYDAVTMQCSESTISMKYDASF